MINTTGYCLSLLCFLVELCKEPVKLTVQIGPAYRSDHSDHQIHRRHLATLPAKPVPDDALYTIPIGSLGDGFFTDHQAEPGAVHSIENNVET